MEINHTDEEINLLVAKAQSHDQEAFHLLYERYQAHVSSRVYAIIRQADSVQDVAQEVWLAAFLALPALKNPAAFSLWLMRIATHKAWKFVQQKALQAILPDADEEVLLLIGDDDPLETVLHDEQRRLIYYLFAQTTDKEREVLTLFYLEGISLAEIATRLGLSLSATKSRLHQARKRLRLILSQGGCFT